jgi:DNA-binding transcriptional MocR family regulator
MGQISFARGIPAPECLPVEALAEAARAALLADGHTILSYGSPSGYEPLRDWIAERHGVERDRVFLTNGGLQGFVFFAQLLAGSGARVLVEEPTYDRPLKILAALGANVEALAMDDEGLDPDALEAALARGPMPAFLYTIPTFQNPSGRTLSTERRRRLVELARTHDLLVLEDDPYSLVRFDGEPQPSLFELEGGDKVVYASSFSKTVSPGIRAGYFILPAALRAQLEAVAVSTYITPVLLGQATVYEFARGGRFETNVARVSDLLRGRRDAMLEALERELGGGNATWSRPDGGYFVWLDVPGSDSNELLDRATAAGVTFVRGTDFGGAPSTMRLAYSFVSPDEIREGIARLAGLVPAAASR